MESLQNSLSNTKYKPDIQPSNIQDCTKNNLESFSSGIRWSRYVTKITEGPTEICIEPSYKEILLTKYDLSVTSEITITPTSICQKNNYKNILKRVQCNTM